MREPPPDPFEGVTFDEDFVRGATRREGSAEERVRRLQEIDAAHRALQRDRKAAPRTERSRRWNRGRLVPVLLVVAVCSLVVYRSTTSDPGSLTEQALQDRVFRFDGEVSAYPPPPDDLSDEPLGRPMDPPADPGPFAFVQTQDGADEPVTYDPCRRIHVVVNDRLAPERADEVLNGAVAELTEVSGLQVVIEGRTDEAPNPSRAPVQTERYGNRWAPVLVAWTDPDEMPGLAGNVAGLGGSQSIARPSGEPALVTGGVFLDAPAFDEVLNRPGGFEQARAIVAHELGHLVGLDHVDDPTQLMHGEGHDGVTHYASGDRAGLIQLGQGPCRPDL